MAENIAKWKISIQNTALFFMDTTGYKFLSGSTKYSSETVEFEPNLPIDHVEISSDSHPFYTGRQKFLKQMDVSTKYGLK